MLLCNNVTPIISSEDPNDITYQASSPDEIALVKIAEKLDMKLILIRYYALYQFDTSIIYS